MRHIEITEVKCTGDLIASIGEVIKICKAVCGDSDGINLRIADGIVLTIYKDTNIHDILEIYDLKKENRKLKKELETKKE